MKKAPPESLNQMESPKQEFSIAHKIITKLHQILKTFSSANIKMYMKIGKHEKFFFLSPLQQKSKSFYYSSEIVYCEKHTLDSTKS